MTIQKIYRKEIRNTNSIYVQSFVYTLTDTIGEGDSRIEIPSVSSVLGGMLGRVVHIPQSHSLHFKFLAHVIQFTLESCLVLWEPLDLKILVGHVSNWVSDIFHFLFASVGKINKIKTNNNIRTWDAIDEICLEWRNGQVHSRSQCGCYKCTRNDHLNNGITQLCWINLGKLYIQ